MVDALIGGFFGNYQQQKQHDADARAAEITAGEHRAARKEAPEDALRFYNMVAPDSSQSERLGVSGAAVGQAMSAPAQQAIARGAQRTQANQKQADFRMQKTQLVQQGARDAFQRDIQKDQIETQDKISQRNATSQTVNGLIANGYPPKQAFQMAKDINNETDRDFSSDYYDKSSPKSDADIKSKKHSARQGWAKQSLDEDKHAKDWITSGNKYELLSKSVLGGKTRDHSIELQKRKKSKERTW